MNGNVVFEGRLCELIRIRGLDLLRAREASGLSQGGLALRLRAMGIDKIGRRDVCQKTVSYLELQESFTVGILVFRVLGAILGAGAIN